ncbi:MAG: hypothetical protein JWQ38_469 [Flavipsychrobacter sp.]|nr:hypothetical protein [Flavipsychrobacter sp.]
MLSKEERLAREIADALNDPDALPLYISFAEKYTEAHLRRLLQRVLSIPQDQIRKTRGALFTYLINQNYGKGNSRD